MLNEAILQLELGKPVQYIVGNVLFYNRKFKVDANVLIPRFETELLVEKAIKYINTNFESPNIVDLGCGSGVIGITLKCEIDKSNVTCIDISENALKITEINCKYNCENIKLIKNSMLDQILDKFDVIISNPPYIGYNESVDPIVYNNEPHLALYASNNGLHYYDKIITQAKTNLNPKGLICFEIGYTQAEEITKLAKKHFPNSKVIVEKDMAEKDRYVFIFVGL